jgi:hypothetical protein
MHFHLIERCRQALAAFRLTPGSRQANYVKEKIVEAIREGVWRGNLSAQDLKALEGTTSHPDYEHWTCGTAHLRAQRALRIIERACHHGLSEELILQIEHLIDQAGIADCRRALAQPMDEVPF